MRKSFLAVICLLAPIAALAQAPVIGIVRDATGAVVSGATILVRTPTGLDQRAVTGPDGRFTLERGVAAQSRLVVRAVGFRETEQAINGAGEMEITLQLAPHLEAVTVTPTRTEQRLRDVPASVSVISRSTSGTSSSGSCRRGRASG